MLKHSIYNLTYLRWGEGAGGVCGDAGWRGGGDAAEIGRWCGVPKIPPAHVRGEDWVEQRTPSGSRWERRGGGRRMSRNLALHKRPPNVSITATTRKHAQH